MSFRLYMIKQQTKETTIERRFLKEDVQQKGILP